ncbi:MAG: hypothetical protein ACFFED_13700 [Candidatus Thorarchaeota archaeon]
MESSANRIGPSVKDDYGRAISCLLPNETIVDAVEILNGFLILTDRRLAELTAYGIQQYGISRSIPYDCIQRISVRKQDEFIMIASPVDTFGRYAKDELIEIPLKAQRIAKDESKEVALGNFKSGIKSISDRIATLQEAAIPSSIPLKRDYAYLEKTPKSLTHNAILDMNAILQDKPIPDELYHESFKFLGKTPFLLEESLRECNDSKSGVLFAAGEQGCIWIRGRKQGRFMENVLVDKIEWTNIKCISYQWQTADSRMVATYTLKKDRHDLQTCFTWSPTLNEDTIEFPWLMQSENGPWIIADLMYKYSGIPLAATYPIENGDHRVNRYFI